jgi:hypothetical protein
MAVSIGDILRTTVGFTLEDGTVAQNIFHHVKTGIGAVSDAAVIEAIQNRVDSMYAEIILAIDSSVVPNLASVDEVAFLEGKWTVIENIGTFVVDFTSIVNEDMLPNQVSAFVTFKTARPKSVGRKFLIPFVEPFQAGSFLTSTAVEYVVAWADKAVNDIVIQVGDNLVPGIVRTVEDTFLEYTLAIVTNVLGSQRRRRPGVGA